MSHLQEDFIHIIDGNFAHNPIRSIYSTRDDQILPALKQAIKHKQ